MLAKLLALTVLLTGSVLAENSADLPDSQSPDGRFALRLRPAPDDQEVEVIEVFGKEGGKVAGTTPSGGYGIFPAAADKANTSVLWSPDSKTLALAMRTTKRSWEIKVFKITATAITEVALPSPTDRAFELLGAKEAGRVVRQEPLRWIDADTLVVLAKGDFEATYYEVEVTYELGSRKITEAKVIVTRPYEG